MRTFTIIILGFLLTGCMARTLQQEKTNMMSMNPVELCIETGAKADFSGWNENRAAAARQLISQRGIQCDWAAVEMVKQQRRAASMANTGAIMQMLNQNVGYQTPKIYQQPTGNYNALTGTTVQPNGAITQQGAGHLVKQYNSGNRRYCNYSKLGKTTTISISTTQLCPLTN